MSELAIATTETADTSRRWADSAGMLASIACAIHCAAMPLVIGYLPLLGLQWLANESFHQVMAGVCFVLAVSAFVPGWKRHGSLIPVTTGIVGVALLSVAAFALEGSCCPTCAEANESQTASQAAEPACTDATCEFCARSEASSTEIAATESTPATDTWEPTNASPAAPTQPTSSAFAWMLPFVTPLGGLFLVMGHIVNHRKSCGCQDGHCCLESVEGE